MASKGKKKRSIHDLSRQDPTREESQALNNYFFDGPPIATAILGQAMIEYELERLLRGRFKRKDETTWSRLTGDYGPLSTFAAKITAGYAFALYDEPVRKNLQIVRNVRNQFAHAKRLISFQDGLVLEELRSATLPAAKNSKLVKAVKRVRKEKDGRLAYTILCTALYSELIRRSTRGLIASSRNYRRWAHKHPFSGLLGPLTSDPTNYLTLLRGWQTSGPKAQAPVPGLLSPDFPWPKSDDSEGT